MTTAAQATAWFARPANRLLVLVLVIAALLGANEAVRKMERNAAAREASERNVRKAAIELTQWRSATEELEKVLANNAGADLPAYVQTFAKNQGLTVESVEGLPAKEMAGERKLVRHSFRIRSAPMGPLSRLLSTIESANGNAIVMELVIRKSPRDKKLLDVEFVTGRME